MRCFSIQQASNVRCEDAVIQHTFSNGSQLFAIFDATSWRSVYGNGGFEVAQEVAVALPRFVWAEVSQLRPRHQSSSQDGGSQKRTRPEQHSAADASVHKALHRALLGLDDHLYAFAEDGKRYGMEAGGSLLLVFVWDGVVHSACVGDCEGAAFEDDVETKLATCPHNVNFVKEMQHVRASWGLRSLDCFYFDPERKLFFLRDLQTTRFLGAWNCKLQCRHQLESGQLCNVLIDKGKFFCAAHDDAERARSMCYWEPEFRTFHSFDFVVWASDGLWDQFTTGRGCEIVARLDAAGRCKAPKVLVDTCLKQAVAAAPRSKKKAQVDPVEFLSSLNSVARRLVHDDVSVCVLFSHYQEPGVGDLQYEPVERSDKEEDNDGDSAHVLQTQ